MESPRGSTASPQHAGPTEAGSGGSATPAARSAEQHVPAGQHIRPASAVLVTRAVAEQIVARRHSGELHVDIGRSLDMTPLEVIDVYLGRATVVDDG
jgi:hypothetical protein